MRQIRKRRTPDRYELEDAVDLGQRPATPKTANVETVLVAVPDPAPDPNRGAGQRVRARVNRRVDILEWERSHGRISARAYAEGRLAQAVFERAAGSAGGSSTWRQRSRVDAEIAKELTILRGIASACETKRYMEQLRDVLGETDAEILRQVLGQNRRYGDVRLPRRPLLSTFDKATEHDVGYVARRFRDALEAVAAAVGRRRVG